MEGINKSVILEKLNNELNFLQSQEKEYTNNKDYTAFLNGKIDAYEEIISMLERE